MVGKCRFMGMDQVECRATPHAKVPSVSLPKFCEPGLPSKRYDLPAREEHHAVQSMWEGRPPLARQGADLPHLRRLTTAPIGGLAARINPCTKTSPVFVSGHGEGMMDYEAVLADLAEGHHSRVVRPLGCHEVAGHSVKLYGLEAPGRTVSDLDATGALQVAAGHLATAGFRGSAGLAVVIFHAGGDGDYLLIQTWIEGHMSDLAIFTGPVGEPEALRPGRAGLGPCVWEAAVFSHERDAFTRVLNGQGPLGERLAAWRADVIEGEVR